MPLLSSLRSRKADSANTFNSTRPSPWTGVLRYTYLLPVFISILNLVIFILSLYFGISLVTTGETPYPPLRNPQWSDKYRNKGLLAVYIGLLPLIALLHSLFSVILHLSPSLSTRRFLAVHAIVASIVFLIAWPALGAFWVTCEIYGGYEAQRQVCPNRPWHVSAEWDEDPAFFVHGWRRVFLVLPLWCGYLVWMIFGAIACHRQRMMKKNGWRRSCDAELRR